MNLVCLLLTCDTHVGHVQCCLHRVTPVVLTPIGANSCVVMATHVMSCDVHVLGWLGKIIVTRRHIRQHVRAAKPPFELRELDSGSKTAQVPIEVGTSMGDQSFD